MGLFSNAVTSAADLVEGVIAHGTTPDEFVRNCGGRRGAINEIVRHCRETGYEPVDKNGNPVDVRSLAREYFSR